MPAQTHRGVGGIGPFFGWTFALTWLCQAPAVLAQQGLLGGAATDYMPFAAFGVLMPALTALALSRREAGPPAMRGLLGTLARPRVPLLYALMALALPGGLLAAGLAMFQSAGYEGPVLLLDPRGLVPALVISVGEELGFRGYAWPRLRDRFSAAPGAGLLGLLWTLWHIPMFVGLGIPLSYLPVMLLYFVGGSLFFAWLVERCRGSVLIAVLAHLGAHLNNSHRALPADAVPLVLHAIIYAGLGVAVLKLDAPNFAGLGRCRPQDLSVAPRRSGASPR